jgi:hypothetical protein
MIVQTAPKSEQKCRCPTLKLNKHTDRKIKPTNRKTKLRMQEPTIRCVGYVHTSIDEHGIMVIIIATMLTALAVCRAVFLGIASYLSKAGAQRRAFAL